MQGKGESSNNSWEDVRCSHGSYLILWDNGGRSYLGNINAISVLPHYVAFERL